MRGPVRGEPGLLLNVMGCRRVGVPWQLPQHTLPLAVASPVLADVLPRIE